MTFSGEAYALPCDTLYYIAGANSSLDDWVRLRLSEISQQAETRGKHFMPVFLTPETLSQYLALRPDIDYPLPERIDNPVSKLSGYLLCRLDETVKDEQYIFAALDIRNCSSLDFENILDAFLSFLGAPEMTELYAPMAETCYDAAPKELKCERKLSNFFPRKKAVARKYEPQSCGSAAPDTEFNIRQQFMDELRQRLENLSDERVNIFLQTLGNDFLKSIKDLAPKPLSSLRIDERYRILLPEYDIEIKMNALWKAIYILFIRHPEGIVLKDLWSFRDELSRIYKRIASGEYERMEASIDDVATPGSDNFRQYLSKINHAFNAVLAVDLAQHYIISGKRGEAYRIVLPADKFELCSKLRELE